MLLEILVTAAAEYATVPSPFHGQFSLVPLLQLLVEINNVSALKYLERFY
jgi:hypothetical protein